MKKIILLSFICLLSSLKSEGQDKTEPFHRVKILLIDKNTHDLNLLDIAIDHGDFKKNQYFISDFSETELERIKLAGFETEYLINNIKKFYSSQNKNLKISEYRNLNYPLPNNFNYGSMGGFYTYEEMLTHLDSMLSKYPHLINKDTLPNRTHENRTVNYYHISDHPDSTELDEPQILFNSLIHAREPMSLTANIYFMWYLLENYESNNQIKQLINHSSITFVPCINPDGYIYNNTNSPDGGGMWRKNRRNNGGDNYGVDLNRNYGYNWGYDNFGSSGSISSNTYRGPSAFSEPETKNIKHLCESRNFKLAFNYHTYGNLLIYPWGYKKSTITPDSLRFEAFSKRMGAHYSCAYGTGDQTVGYVTNGDSDDWMYGEQETKDKILSFTPEAGASSYGFYPNKSRILPICEDMLTQNIKALEYLQAYIEIQDLNSSILHPNHLTLHFSFNKLGLDTSSHYKITLHPLHQSIDTIIGSRSYTQFTDLSSFKDSFQITLNDTLLEGEKIQFLLTTQTDFYTYTDTITKFYAKQDYYTSSNLEWESELWNNTNENYFSNPFSITDSPLEKYENNQTNTINLSKPINLTQAKNAYLSFMGYWNIEHNFDYFIIEASEKDEDNWTTLPSNQSRKGTKDQDYQDIHDGRNMEWQFVEVNLNDFIGKEIDIRYSLISDNATSRDGIYIDDLNFKWIYNPFFSIEENKNETYIISDAFPNPSDQSITIHYNISKTQGNEFKLINNLGQTIHTSINLQEQGFINIDLSNTPSGTYYYKITGNEKSTKVKKLIIIH